MILVLSEAALAWEPGEPVVIAGAAVDVVALDGGVAVTAPDGTRFIDHSGVVTRIGDGGVALIAADLTGDRRDDLVVCGATGTTWYARAVGGVHLGGLVASSPCHAIARGGTSGAPAIVVADASGIVSRTAFRGSVNAPKALGPAVADPVLAAVGTRAAVASRGGTQIVEYSERGQSTFALDVPIADLAVSNGQFAWTAGAAIGDATGRVVPLAPLAGALLAADLDGDEIEEWIVLHGPDRYGVVTAAGERVFALPVPAVAIAAGSADDDACRGLIAVGPGGVVLIPGVCAPPIVAVAVAPAAPEAPIAARSAPRTDAVAIAVVRGAIPVVEGGRVDVFVGQYLDAQLRSEVYGARFVATDAPAGATVSPDGRLTFSPTGAQVGAWPLTVRVTAGLEIVTTATLAVHVHATP